jgi:FAD/FMN-containing dehydrogenase
VPEWSNWSGGVSCRAHEIAAPGSEAELVALVERASHEGRTLRPVGSGHSFSPVVATDGIVVSLDRLAGLESHDRDGCEATARAGTKLHDLGQALLEQGLAMENLGDVDVQALGGALATGTHGTGRTLGNLSSRVSWLRLVGAGGAVHECDATNDPDLFRAARVSLGGLGIVTAVRLHLLPAYRLHERTWRAPLDEILDELDSLVLAHRHFEFFYFPKHDFAEAKAIDPTEAGRESGSTGARASSRRCARSASTRWSTRSPPRPGPPVCARWWVACAGDIRRSSGPSSTGPSRPTTPS